MTQKHTNVFSKCFSAVAEPKVAINIRESEEEHDLKLLCKGGAAVLLNMVRCKVTTGVLLEKTP